MAGAYCESRRGVASVLAMLFLVIISVLAIAMMGLARTNSQVAMNQDSVERARTNAESGMRWIAWKFATVSMPKTLKGVIDDTVATSLWPTVITNMTTDLNGMSSTVVKTKETTYDSYGHPQLHVVVSIPSTGAAPYPVDFEVLATSGPTSPSWATGAASFTSQAQVIGVQCRGTCKGVSRIIKAYFLMQKTLPYGVVTKIPIQLGKNTVVEGDVYYASAPKDSQPPVLSISDFRYTSATLSDGLTTQVQKLQDCLKANYSGSDNRVADTPANASLIGKLQAALPGISDYNGDGYYDEYDLMLRYFDTNGSNSVARGEFQQGAPNDPNLFNLLDQSIGKSVPGSQIPGRTGLNDNMLDAFDTYAKVTGTIRIWETQAALSARLASNGDKIGGVMQGSIVSPDPYAQPVLYGQNDSADAAALITPDIFNQGAFLDLAGSGGGSAVPRSPTPYNTTNGQLPEPDPKDPAIDPVYSPLSRLEYANTSVSASSLANGTVDAKVINDMKANGDTGLTYTTATVYSRDASGKVILDGSGNPVTKQVQALTRATENVPYGSTGVRSTVSRPVVSGMVFRNCVINRGSNALFINCRFDGVTFVDGAYTMAQSTSDYAKGNNFRFLNCTFTGPLVQGDATATGSNRGATPTSYTDYTNSWEFSGTTTIDLRQPAIGGIGSKDGVSDSHALAAIKQQATIQAPQTNIEMGSYTSPGNATCSFQGIVVAGCFDCRGVADIDGSIIVPSTAAGNCTLGYFGSNDNATNQGQPDPNMVNAGNGAYGRIHVRFNPLRRLPDGINLSVSIYPDLKSMEEVTQWQPN